MKFYDAMTEAKKGLVPYFEVLYIAFAIRPYKPGVLFMCIRC